jgi:antirestriction protein ArdC
MAKLSQKERIEQLTNEMNKSIDLFQTDPKEQIELLEYLSRFNQYSVRNIVLIKSQYEGAVGVKSYKQHQEEGHQVQKGEKSIRILAPKFYKQWQDEDNNWRFYNEATKEQKQKINSGEIKSEERLVGYISVPVFDLTQTDCPADEYPNLYPNRPENYSFNGDTEDLERLETAIENIAKREGIKISDETFQSAAKGYYSPSEEKIVLQNSLSETERPKVLLHELAHARMHNADKISEKIMNEEDISTPILEYQAEMTAYVVSNEIGLDTKESSISYLASWQKNSKDYTLDSDNYIKALDEVRNVSDELSTEIFEEYQALEQTQNKNETIKNKVSFTISYKDQSGNVQEENLVYPTNEVKVNNLIYNDQTTDFEIKNLPKELSYLNGKVTDREVERLEDVAISYQENKQYSNALGTNSKENNMTLVEYIKDNYPTDNIKIAEKMYFLNDENNINNFKELKEENLKPANIYIENKQNYQNNYLQLTDGEKIYNQKITTTKLGTGELKEWRNGKTGNEWLETDMTFQIHKDKPHQFIKQTNFYESNEVFEKLKPFNEQVEEKSISNNSPSLK